jgi:hypothetical protein
MKPTGAVISFDPEHHRYTVDGKEYPSVSQIIREGRQEKFTVDKWYLMRGQRIHEAIALHGEGRLDMEQWFKVLQGAQDYDMASGVVGRVRAAIAFSQEYIVSIGAQHEVKLHHPTYGYCGTADAIATLKGTLKRCVVDWKGSLSPLVEPQLGAYSLASTLPCDMACGVELHDDGTYKCHWGSRHPKRDEAQFNLGQAERVFLAMLTVRNFNLQHNLIGKNQEE